MLTFLGLTVAGIATYGALRNFLLDRIDTQLRAAASGPGPGGACRPGYDGGRSEIQRAGCALYDGDGDLVDGNQGMPASLTRRSGFETIGIGGEPYRLYVSRVVFSPRSASVGPTDGFLAVALPLGDVNATLNRLLMIEILVGVVALGVAATAGWALVRVGLQPLTDIERTAERIAEGDLSHRVPDGDPATEVGRLGHSLNVMLGQIEESFAEREASERRLRQFVADASHELQTPLTSVRGYAELFRRGAADRPEDLRTAMRRIEAEAERMGVLVDDLLLLARLDQGRELEHRPVDLVQVVRDQAGDLRVVAPDHPVTVIAPVPVEVMGDEVRLRQVVTNLLSNARMHTPDGTRIEVTVTRDDGEAVITIADDGPGIPEENRERLFERFFRADPSRARKSGGSGLGLSIVAAIAESHGGSVSVSSPGGGGTVFTVRLPVAGRAPAGDAPGSDPTTERQGADPR